GFFREIDRRDPQMRIFLATDSCDVLECFKRRYRDRVLSIPNERPNSEPQISNSTNDYAITRAFSDMICLSKGSLLIGSYLSTFTECAWWFGGCRQHVVIV